VIALAVFAIGTAIPGAQSEEKAFARKAFGAEFEGTTSAKFSAV